MKRSASMKFARVRAVRSEGGVPVADVVDLDGGVWNDVRFLVLGGGLGSFVYAPPQRELVPSPIPSLGQGGEVVLWFPPAPPGGRPRPWILGAVMNDTDAQAVLDLVPVTPETDYKAVGVDDVALRRGGSTILISPVAGPVIDAGPGHDVRVQLQLTQAIRISINGEAGDGILLATPTRALMDLLIDRVNTLSDMMAQILAWGQTQTPPLPFGQTVIPPTDLPTPEDVASLSIPIPSTSKALESAAVKISSLVKEV